MGRGNLNGNLREGYRLPITCKANMRRAAARHVPQLLTMRCMSTGGSGGLIRSVESAGEAIGKKLKLASNQAQKYDIPQKAGDKVLKGAAVVGAGLQTVLMFKKTVAVGALALAATAVGKVKAPEITNKIVGTTVKAAGVVAQGGSALVRGVRSGMADQEEPYQIQQGELREDLSHPRSE